MTNIRVRQLRKPKQRDRSDRIPFGKYRGETVRTVLHVDPGWLLWAVQETPLYISPEVLREAKLSAAAGNNVDTTMY